MSHCRACDALDDICPRHERMAEDRYLDYDDAGMADREADRYERWLGGER